MTSDEKAQILAGVKRVTLARLAALVATNATPTHDNADAYYSPARWWYDTDRTVRHGLTTTASISMSGSTISISLGYSIDTVS